ncbi:MAG: hypothetical protein AAGJ32_09835 [Pseudomonadota bacterium]
MFETIYTVSAGLSAALAGLATGAAWIVTVAAPNCSFDRLDYSRADGHVRELLVASSPQIAGILLAAAAFAMLGQAYGAAILSVLAAIGFFSNTWTLARRKKKEAPPGVRQRKKTQRVVAVWFSLMFGIVAAIASVLAVFGI